MQKRARSGFSAQPKIKMISPTLRLELARIPIATSNNITNSINNGEIDTSKGIEQFSPLEQKAIEDALRTGDRSEMTPKLNAFIDFQVAKSRSEIQEAQTSDEAFLQEQAAIQSAKIEQEALIRDAAIKTQERKQLAINVSLVAVSLGALYYLARR
jgi:hypothetical protein